MIALIFSIGLGGHVHAQGSHRHDMGESIIEFLMTEPRMANTSIPAETEALRYINSLYQINRGGKGQGEENGSGRQDQILINYTHISRRPARLIKDNNGNPYMLFEGRKYRIRRELLYQALSTPITTMAGLELPPYDPGALRESFNDDGDSRHSCIITANGYKDKNGNGNIGLDEFHEIKRTFNKDEPLYIGYKYNNESGLSTKVTVTIFHELDSRVVKVREFETRNKQASNIHFIIFSPPLELESGVYLVHVKHQIFKKKGRLANKGVIIKRERFSIL